MRSRTIYSAIQQAEREMRVGLASYAVHVNDPELVKRTRQWGAFGRELLRRMDEMDAIRRELAEARAYISTIIDAPKDYPAEESA